MDSLRALPSVDQVLRQLQDLPLPHTLVRDTIRAVLTEQRALLHARTGVPEPIEGLVRRRLESLLEASLRPVINATGVILHTNLGRSPLARFSPIQRYSNLEYDLSTGKRGKRDAHTTPLLEALLNRAAILVNNNAAAVFLVLQELAAGEEVIVSRGELIEIGDGFRIPDIMARSGAILREVGTTNRTHIADYESAITSRTRLILRVHRSNFQVSGFTAQPELRQLAVLARSRGIPLYEDLGSGCLVDLKAYGIEEPLVNESFDAGVDLLSFSCDKLLGGPQSGIIAGNADLVARIRRNPLYRALRVDKLTIESLQGTLRALLLQRSEDIPTLAMIQSTPHVVQQRAERIASGLSALKPVLRDSRSPIGGGSTPDQTLPTTVVCLDVPSSSGLEHRLRQAATPVIARIENGQLILDPRTIADEEVAVLVASVLAAV